MARPQGVGKPEQPGRPEDPGRSERARQRRSEVGKRKMLRRGAQIARREGVDFTLVEDDFTIPEVCPILNIELNVRARMRDDDYPIFLRTDINLPYEAGNIQVVSFKAWAEARG